MLGSVVSKALSSMDLWVQGAQHLMFLDLPPSGKAEGEEVGDEIKHAQVSPPLTPPSLCAEPIFFYVLTPLMPIVSFWCCQLLAGITSSTSECGSVFFRHVVACVAGR